MKANMFKPSAKQHPPTKNPISNFARKAALLGGAATLAASTLGMPKMAQAKQTNDVFQPRNNNKAELLQKSNSNKLLAQYNSFADLYRMCDEKFPISTDSVVDINDPTAGLRFNQSLYRNQYCKQLVNQEERRHQQLQQQTPNNWQQEPEEYTPRRNSDNILPV